MSSHFSATATSDATIAQMPLRDPAKVMRLKRLGAAHRTRLSFLEVLLRRIHQEQWRFERPVFRLDERGVGVATYAISTPQRTYTLVAFAHELPDHLRSDRVIAEAWDATFTLFDGSPDESDLERLAAHVPYQEKARLQDTELTLSRANRSVRLFQHVVERLAAGAQPDREQLQQVGYLMRTTAVYGAGKFGASDRSRWSERAEFSGSFQPEMLTVWLIRAFTIDWVEHFARIRNPSQAVRLDAALKRELGVGNSTGLGMAPFLLNHPALLHAWIHARETALARVRAAALTDAALTRFSDSYKAALDNVPAWREPLADADYRQRLQQLELELPQLWDEHQRLLRAVPTALHWNELYLWSEQHTSLDCQEQLVSLLLDTYPECVDELATGMSADESNWQPLPAKETVASLRVRIEEHYDWALQTDFTSSAATARVWYVSAEKLEPRLGEREDAELADYEQPLAPGRDIAALHRDLAASSPGTEPLSVFLIRHPQHRHSARRVLLTGALPYAEIRDNTVSDTLLPIDMLRCKLALFGAGRFDPRSDRWLRINLFRLAPYPDELAVLEPAS